MQPSAKKKKENKVFIYETMPNNLNCYADAAFQIGCKSDPKKHALHPDGFTSGNCGAPATTRTRRVSSYDEQLC